MNVVPEQITGFIFVFNDVNILENGMEVCGMDIVQVLHGWAMENGIKLVFVPSFASECNGFSESYSVWADAALGLWQGVVQGLGSFLIRQLNHCALSQGLSFCSKHLPPVYFKHWMWEWLFEFWRKWLDDITICCFSKKRKCIVVRKGGLIFLYLSLFKLEWMRFKTRDQLAILHQLLSHGV